jgi:16S rRNA (cytosine1402-N4)-methyltransferase
MRGAGRCSTQTGATAQVAPAAHVDLMTDAGHNPETQPGSPDWAPHRPAHEPVMLAECLEWLSPSPGGVVVDATLGLGGHAVALLEHLGPTGRLVGLDRDPESLRHAGIRLQASCAAWGWTGCPILLVHTDFRDLGPLLREHSVEAIDGILFDLGVSSMQLDLSERGFSFRASGPLDMRMDPTAGDSAADIVNSLPEVELARIIWEYGEERYSRRIARRLVERRPIHTTAELAEIARLAYPAAERHRRIHPATRTFQALRIYVNDELASLEPALLAAAGLLRPGGRIVVLAYHSLEDRIVKRTFEYLAGRCRCPPQVPICACGAEARLKILTRKPLTPSPAEIERNSRARSARLRAAERR